MLPRVTRTFDVYPPLIVPREKEGFLRHRSSCLPLCARGGAVRLYDESCACTGRRKKVSGRSPSNVVKIYCQRAHNLAKDRSKTVLRKVFNIASSWQLRSSQSSFFYLSSDESFKLHPHLRLKYAQGALPVRFAAPKIGYLDCCWFP